MELVGEAIRLGPPGGWAGGPRHPGLALGRRDHLVVPRFEYRHFFASPKLHEKIGVAITVKRRDGPRRGDEHPQRRLERLGARSAPPHDPRHIGYELAK